MLVIAKCRKCGVDCSFDIGTMTVDEAKKQLGKLKTSRCSFGGHQEVIPPLELFEFDWDNLVEGEAPSDDEALETLKKSFKEVHLSKSLQDKYNILSFVHNTVLVSLKSDGDVMKTFLFSDLPSGVRAYYTNE